MAHAAIQPRLRKDARARMGVRGACCLLDLDLMPVRAAPARARHRATPCFRLHVHAEKTLEVRRAD